MWVPAEAMSSFDGVRLRQRVGMTYEVVKSTSEYLGLDVDIDYIHTSKHRWLL